MKKSMVTMCLLFSTCNLFASNHVTSTELMEYKAKYLQKKEEIRLIKNAINDVENDIIVQTVNNLEIEPLRNQLNTYNEILDRGYEPYPNWIFNKITNLKEDIQKLDFYLKAKSKAYGDVEKNYNALIRYINENTSADVRRQGSYNFSVNGETIVSY